jgi:3-oxoacyl-[acyl-carrier protein] reductase
MRLKGKIAVITGSGRGIGRLIALGMAQEGAKVVVNGTTQEKVDQVVGEIKEAGKVAVANYDDIATMVGAEALIKTAVDNFGRVDILINNAGISRDALFYKMTEEAWDEVMRVDLKGVFCCIKAVFPVMKEQNYGRIINVASVAGVIGNVGQANYSAAKAGVIALTKTLAKEFGRYNITVNCISASHRTRMYENVPEDVFQQLLKRRALGRMSREEEIAPAFIFLASDEASYITGQHLGVDGGLL